MDDKQRTGLTAVPASAGLLRGNARTGLVARGRREATGVASNAHAIEAAAHYAKGDFAQAAESFHLAAEQGHAESQYMLSTLLDAGKGVPQDASAAALWERRAAEQGHAYAQANLSYRCYESGEFAEAFAWCMRAAHSQLAWAQFHVGLMYRKGEGVERSDSEAARWYRLAAGQQFGEAQAKLAELYTFGVGVERDLSQAALLYQQAATQGHAEAQYQLGLLYATGQGTEPDYVRSRHWIREAALQGHTEAAQELKRREYRDP